MELEKVGKLDLNEEPYLQPISICSTKRQQTFVNQR